MPEVVFKKQQLSVGVFSPQQEILPVFEALVLDPYEPPSCESISRMMEAPPAYSYRDTTLTLKMLYCGVDISVQWDVC